MLLSVLCAIALPRSARSGKLCRRATHHLTSISIPHLTTSFSPVLDEVAAALMMHKGRMPKRPRTESGRRNVENFPLFHTIKLILSEWCDVHGVFLFITVCICSLTTILKDEEVKKLGFRWNGVLTEFSDSKRV